MNELDQKIRNLVKTIVREAPEPPKIRADSGYKGPASTGIGPLVGVMTFVLIVGAFAGLAWLFRWSDRTPPSGDPGHSISTVSEVSSQPVISWEARGLGVSDTVRGSSGRLILSDERYIYVASGHGGVDRLYAVTALDLVSGDVVWQREDLGDTPHSNVFLQAVTDAELVVNGQYGTLKAVEPGSGQLRWQFFIPEEFGVVSSTAVQHDGSILVEPLLIVTAETPRDIKAPRVYALENARTLWETTLVEGTAFQWSSPQVASGVVLLSLTPSHPQSGTSNTIHGIDLATGEHLWATDVGGVQGFHPYPILIGGETLFVRGGSGIVALTAQTGEEIWRYDNTGAFPLATRGDGAIYATDTGRVLILHPKTGQPSVLVDGISSNDLPIGGMETQSGDLITVTPLGLRAYDSDGTQRWSWDSGGQIVDWDMRDTYAVIATTDGSVRRVDLP